MSYTYWKSESKTVHHERLKTMFGEAKFENGKLVKGNWGSGCSVLSVSGLSIQEWTDLLMFAQALHQRIVGRHYVIVEWENIYIWVSFEEDANLDALISYYAAVFEERYGRRPNVLLMHPGESYDLPRDIGYEMDFLTLKRSEIIHQGTFRIGYEEPKDAEETQSD